MKTKFTLLFLFLGGLVYSAVEYDFRKGIDFTGRGSTSAAMFNQLVDNATLSTNKGLVIVSPTEPDILNNSRYTNFLWVDTSVAGFPTLKFYNGTTWTNSLIGATITTTNLADGAVTTAKLASGAVSSDKVLSGAIGSLQLGGSSVTGDKIAVGVVSRQHIADGSINTDQLTNSSVTAAKIADATITSGKIATIDAGTITNLSSYTLSQSSVLGFTNLPAAGGTNYVLISGVSSLNWTTAPLAQIVYAEVTETNSGTANGMILQKPHSLGRNPYFYRVAFEVTNSIAGYQIGDELTLDNFTWANGTYRYPFLHASCNSTSVSIRADGTYFYPGAAFIYVPNWTNGSEFQVGGSRFPTNFGRFKFYVQ